jgi:hypothetical protein
MNTATELTADARASVRTGSAPRPGVVHVVNGTHCAIWEESKDFDGVAKIFRETVAMLRGRGWTLGPHRIYKTDGILGTKGALGVAGHSSGRTCELEFFRTAKPWDNQNGPEYEFQKWERIKAASAAAPGLRLLAIVEMAHVVGKWLQYGYDFKNGDRTAPIAREVLRMAEDRPYYGDALEAMKRSWSNHYDKDGGWLPDGRYRDAMSHTPGVKRGDVVYFRPDYGAGDHYLQRGIAYPDFNGSWMIDNGSEYIRNVFPRNIFRAYPEGDRRRVVPGQRDRLESELERARKAKAWKRVGTLAGVLERMGAKA